MWILKFSSQLRVDPGVWNRFRIRWGRIWNPWPKRKGGLVFGVLGFEVWVCWRRRWRRHLWPGTTVFFDEAWSERVGCTCRVDDLGSEEREISSWNELVLSRLGLNTWASFNAWRPCGLPLIGRVCVWPLVNRTITWGLPVFAYHAPSSPPFSLLDQVRSIDLTVKLVSPKINGVDRVPSVFPLGRAFDLGLWGISGCLHPTTTCWCAQIWACLSLSPFSLLFVFYFFYFLLFFLYTFLLKNRILIL